MDTLRNNQGQTFNEWFDSLSPSEQEKYMEEMYADDYMWEAEY